MGQTDGAKAELSPDLDDQSEDYGVEMHVIVCIHMVQWEASTFEGFKLCSNLRFQLPPHFRAEEKVTPRADQTR